jgi:hypothetical protein
VLGRKRLTQITRRGRVMWTKLESLRSRLGSRQRSHSLLITVIWALVVLIIAVLALRHVTSAKDVADLISATASLLWPIIAITVITWFRPELRALLARIKKGKFLGQEIELDELQASTEAAVAKAEETAAESSPPLNGTAEGTGSTEPQSGHAEEQDETDAAQKEIEEVFREAAKSPRIGLMLLSSKIERAARNMAEAIGSKSPRRGATLKMLIGELVEAGQLTLQDANALALFSQTRNQIVHGGNADDTEVARAIDSGTRLLRLLLSTPRSPQILPHPGPTYD